MEPLWIAPVASEGGFGGRMTDQTLGRRTGARRHGTARLDARADSESHQNGQAWLPRLRCGHSHLSCQIGRVAKDGNGKLRPEPSAQQASTLGKGIWYVPIPSVFRAGVSILKVVHYMYKKTAADRCHTIGRQARESADNAGVAPALFGLDRPPRYRYVNDYPLGAERKLYELHGGNVKCQKLVFSCSWRSPQKIPITFRDG